MTDRVPAQAAGRGIGAPNPGLVTRLVSGLRYAMTGAAPSSWFGPALPPAPAAPQAVGRQFDYPVGFNLRIQPREDSGVSFAELRQIAERWDLLRLVIETRKDQIARLPWAVRPRPARKGCLAAGPDDPRLVWLEDFLQDPDREHGWAGWLRMLLEDLFVIDAPTLYLRRDAAGSLAALEIVDGATIKRILSPDGRTPFPPDPAYQQVLKGIPAVDYTSGELLYWPRNPRPHRVYGFSPVEQIVMTANIALRRAVSQLNHFTEGNTPEALIGVPEAWTPDQIRQFQEYWDALLQGNLAARRHSRFVPGGLTYQPTREPPLKDDFDEWLARIVCFAFAIPATAFAGQTNRATAETAQAASQAEGLEPLRQWLKDLLDRVISRVLGWPDLEFVWADTSAADPQSQVQLHAAYVAAGIKTRNEVRAVIGLQPIAGGDQATVAGAVSPLPGVGGAGGGIAKYTPTELRDWHGRWTTGAGGEAPPAPARSGTSDGNSQAAAGDTTPPDSTATSDWHGGGRVPRLPVYSGLPGVIQIADEGPRERSPEEPPATTTYRPIQLAGGDEDTLDPRGDPDLDRILDENLKALQQRVAPPETPPTGPSYFINPGTPVNAEGEPIPERPYSDLLDPLTVGAGKPFTRTQKRYMYQQNIRTNGGNLRSDEDGIELVTPKKSQAGVVPPPNEAQIDHIDPRVPSDPNATPGSNSYRNARVVSRQQNRDKSNK